MHLLVRESHGLDEAAAARDLGQTSADLVFLSFSDADLGALAAAWESTGPSLRLANLAQLTHPMSVDIYADQVVAKAKCVVLRLLGGLDYFRYGAEEFFSVCRAAKIPFAILPGDGPDTPALAALSTMPAHIRTALDTSLRAGGPAMAQALALAAQAAGLPAAARAIEPLPQHGIHASDPDPSAAIVFYRSHLVSADIAPIEALAKALRARGLSVGLLYVASLKSPDSAAFAAATLAAWKPNVVLNATNFSATSERGSPLDAAGAPVLQLVLAGTDRPAWERSRRGLTPADLAMQVVLPELDGRLLTTAISFKAEAPTDAALQYARKIHAPDADGIALAADRAAGWTRLATTPAHDRRIAIVLSDYPGLTGQRGHAVGLDSFASLANIFSFLPDYDNEPADAPALVQMLCHDAPTPFMSLTEYRRRFATLPETIQASVTAAWGDPSVDPSIAGNAFTLRHRHLGKALVAIQPPRAHGDVRRSYHDPDAAPCHGFLAFYLGLADIHAIVHLGTHGTLEWLPGKSVALGRDCIPQALIGGTPMIYPFIVNNPGEAAPAKRRLGAVTIGHLTPPMSRAAHHGPAREIEHLIEEYAAADGLDRRRTTALRTSILDRAQACGLLTECGADAADPDDSLARLDAHLCDVKDLQLRHGLHIYGQPPAARDAILSAMPNGPDIATRLDACAEAERTALRAALEGRFIPPGPAGAPTRGRADVLPTGRNLTTADPRAIPTRSAMTLAKTAAAELLRRHLQDHGEYPRTIMIDLWGSTTLRTGGENLALAFILLGVHPLWDEASARVSGFEVLPLALLDRPRIDVTLRISGLFRDAFETQTKMFDNAVRAVAARDEAPDWNPLAGQPPTARIFGPQAGQYGAGGDRALAGAWSERSDLGRSWLEASSGTYGQNDDGAPDPTGLAARVAGAEAFVHNQDHAEIDLLDTPEHAAHEGGFAAAAASLGATPALYHLDTSRPEIPRARLVAEEIFRVVRGRAANPAWIAAMIPHGYRGAAEIARGIEALHHFAATLPTRFDDQFDLLFAATLGDPKVDDFLRTANPDAHAALTARFAEARTRNLWHPSSNSAGAA